jgi:hypothetical protein
VVRCAEAGEVAEAVVVPVAYVVNIGGLGEATASGVEVRAAVAVTLEDSASALRPVLR